MGWSKRVSVGGSHQSGGLYTGLKPKKRGDSTFILLKRFPAGLKFMHLTRLRFEIIMVRFIQHAPQNRSWLFSSPSKVVHAERKVNRSCMVAPPHATTAPQVARHAPLFSGRDRKKFRGQTNMNWKRYPRPVPHLDRRSWLFQLCLSKDDIRLSQCFTRPLRPARN